jgi:hypothetical protein
MVSICQHFYTLGVEVYFTIIGDFTWRVSDCEGLVGLLTGKNEFIVSLPVSLHPLA